MKLKPQKTMKGITFFPVPEFTRLEAANGAQEEAYFDRHDLPEIPKEFLDKAADLFFSGGILDNLSSKVDNTEASCAVSAWLSSWAPAHEAKMATVAYALWLWSDDEALGEEA